MKTLNENKTYLYFFENGKTDHKKYKQVSSEFVFDFLKNKTAINHLQKKGRLGGFIATVKGQLA